MPFAHACPTMFYIHLYTLVECNKSVIQPANYISLAQAASILQDNTRSMFILKMCEKKRVLRYFANCMSIAIAKLSRLKLTCKYRLHLKVSKGYYTDVEKAKGHKEMKISVYSL